ncbi:extracellular solute-binding protein [Alloscardovia omnicolens]|uniref:extracellular solute-binding protein n=1 Tax=Alloscardovia omnicolens TaxID=419015 RepID=UPI003A7A995A
MTSKFVKLTSVAVAAVLALSTLSACGSSSKESVSKLPEPTYKVSQDTPAWKSDKSKNNTLTWYVNADWWNSSFGKDLVTRQLQKDLNLKIKFITGDDAKLNTFFASGDMPDIITTFDVNSKIARTASQWALPLEQLGDKYDPYFKKTVRKETMDWYRMKDGNVYGYPSYANTKEDYESGMIPPRQAFVIRQDVLNAIGSQDFTTPDGFRQGMQAIKDKFPDLVPFGFENYNNGSNGGLDVVMQDLLGVPILTSDKKFNNRNTDSEYVKWLETLRQVHQDGNISDDSFSDDSDTYKEKVASGKYATMILASSVGQSTPLQAFKANNPGAEYVAVDAIRSTDGRKPTLSQGGMSGWSISYISKKTKNPAKAIQLFEYLLSDYGQMLTNFGIEGDTYVKNDDGTISWSDKAQKLRLEDPDKFVKDYRCGEFVLFGHDRYKALNKDTFVEALWQMQHWGQEYLTPQFEIENTDPDTGTREARSLSAVKTNWGTTLVSLIRANSQKEFDNLLTEYQNFEKSNGIDAINKLRNEKIAENMKKLGE